MPNLIGLLLAAVLLDYIGKRFNSRVASTLRAMYYLPQFLPVVVTGIVWNWILNAQTGALNSILRGLGVNAPPNWLGSASLALPSVMIVLIWIQIGYLAVIVMSALQRADPGRDEAAELDGDGLVLRAGRLVLTSADYGVFVDHLGGVSFEVGSQVSTLAQFSVEGERLTYYLIDGPTLKDVLRRYTAPTCSSPP